MPSNLTTGISPVKSTTITHSFRTNIEVQRLLYANYHCYLLNSKRINQVQSTNIFPRSTINFVIETLFLVWFPLSIISCTLHKKQFLVWSLSWLSKYPPKSISSLKMCLLSVAIIVWFEFRGKSIKTINYISCKVIPHLKK